MELELPVFRAYRGAEPPRFARPAERLPADDRTGEIYLSAAEIAVRVRELGAEIARDYSGREPVLVGSLKASLVFVADLSRAIRILHSLDFVELAGYGSARMGGH